MIYFNNDYSEGCHEKVLEKLIMTNMEQTPGYSEDCHCLEAADKIREICQNPDLNVHFLVGGTQTNLTVIASALRPHQAVIGAESAHINTHETGAIEATGHKVLWVPSSDGKLRAAQVDALVQAHWEDPSFEHTPQPGMVYISNPTEYGTIYSLAELKEISEVCKRRGLYMFLDGARLGYGLMAQDNDVTMADLARLCDVFYIGGTKVGALFGEAVVISNPTLAKDFRYIMKQRGGMLAKGRLLGVQFSALMEDNLYFDISAHAVKLADRIRNTLKTLGYSFHVDNTTNQLFPILPVSILEKLAEKYAFISMDWVGKEHRVIRICTSWATKEENVEAFCEDLVRYSEAEKVHN